MREPRRLSSGGLVVVTLVTAALALGAFLLVRWDTARSLASGGERLRQLEEASAPLTAAAEELREIEARKAKLERQIGELQRLAAARQAPAALLAVLAGAEQRGVEVGSFRLSGGEASLSGLAEDEAAYRSLRAAFEEIAGVRRVEEIGQGPETSDPSGPGGQGSGERSIDWRIILWAEEPTDDAPPPAPPG